MGYGPRIVGSISLDFRLFEDNLPDYSFELYPTQKGATFKTQQPHIIQLNNCRLSSSDISEGDLIFIKDTQIQVHFLDHP